MEEKSTDNNETEKIPWVWVDVFEKTCCHLDNTVSEGAF